MKGIYFSYQFFFISGNTGIGLTGELVEKVHFCFKFETTFFTIHHLILTYPLSEFWTAADIDFEKKISLKKKEQIFR